MCSKGFRYTAVYSVCQEKLIKDEFSRLKDQCYLEHAGATLYSEKQMSNILKDFTENTFGNPHAKNISSKLTEDSIDQIRYKILEYFNTNTDEYSVIFTSGATAALRLVAESFQYEQGTFVYLEDNHTSVLGMREYAEYSTALKHDDAFSLLSNKINRTKEKPNVVEHKTNSLFVYPAQCNFSGTKYPLAWIENVQTGALNNGANKSTNWFCMLDAASFVSTSFLDLSKYKPDFVCLSFYKIFGYPTGLGALLVKNSSAHVLRKRYFGGGTVLMALSLEHTHVPRNVLHEYFEDGTLPFLSIIALRHGFDTLKRFFLHINEVSEHTFALARYVYKTLLRLHHGNGQPAVILYHDTNFDDRTHQGGIVNFNILRPTGEYIGYAEIMHVANLYGVHLRTGCFCNPGACRRHLGLTSEDIKHHFNSGHVCGDQHDIIDGRPTGSVRISFGYMSTKQDADTFINMIEECYILKPLIRRLPMSWENVEKNYERKFKMHALINGHTNITNGTDKNNITNDNGTKRNCDTNTTNKISTEHEEGVLEQMFIYPIKSCAAFQIKDSWELISTGLKYDRQWMIVNSNGVCVTQKNNTRLCLIKPQIDANKGLLVLNYEGLPSTSVSLKFTTSKFNSIGPWKCQSKVCGDRIQGWDCGNDVGLWLSEVLDIPGLRLLRQCNNDNEPNRLSKIDDNQLSLANQAQFLLINKASVQWLMNSIPGNYESMQGLIDRFRPNFVVNFPCFFVENSWTKLQIGDALFKSIGRCTRCQMICVDQSTGDKTHEPLKTLSREFNGKIAFGIYLNNASRKNHNTIKVDDPVIANVER